MQEQNQVNQIDWQFINGQAARLKSELGLVGDVLYTEHLAKVLNQPVKFVWNAKARGTLPDIPVLSVGGRDAFWIVHVVLWMQGHSMATMPAHASEFKKTGDPSQAQSRNSSISARGVASESEVSVRKTKHKEMSVAKAALLARANKILEERRNQQ